MYIDNTKEGVIIRSGEDLTIRVSPRDYHENISCVVTAVHDSSFLVNLDVTEKEGSFYYLKYNTTGHSSGTYQFSFWGHSSEHGFEKITDLWVSIVDNLKRI
jgi:hypothetical protein